MNSLLSNAADNIGSIKISGEGILIEDSTSDTKFTDENFSDSKPSKYSDLYSNEVFLHERSLFEKNFVDAIKNYELDDFYESFADKTFKKFYDKYDIAAIEWLNNILINNLNKPYIICGVLKVLSNLKYYQLQSWGVTMLLVVVHVNNKSENPEVSDLIINCIENWDDKQLITILEALQTSENFLQLYKSKVIEQLF